MSSISADPEITPGLIQQVRTQVLDAYMKSPSLFEETDITRLKEDEDLVRRYLSRENYDLTSTVDTIISAFHWLKRERVADIRNDEFCKELQNLFLFSKSKDKDFIYFRYKTAKKILTKNSVDELSLRRLMLLFLKKLETETRGQCTLIVDARTFGIADMFKYLNNDLASVIMWLFIQLIRYWPSQFGSIVLYEMPTIFSVVLERIVKLLPQEINQKIKFMGKKELRKLVAKDDLPDFMGGNLIADGFKNGPDVDIVGEDDELIEDALEAEEALWEL